MELNIPSAPEYRKCKKWRVDSENRQSHEIVKVLEVRVKSRKTDELSALHIVPHTIATSRPEDLRGKRFEIVTSMKNALGTYPFSCGTVEYKMERKTPGRRTQLFAVLLLGAASLYLTWSLVGLSNDVKTLVLLKRRRSSIIRATDSYCEDLPISPYQSFNLPKSIRRKRSSKATSYRGKVHKDDSPRKCSLRYHGTRGRTRMALDGDDWRWARPNRQREANVRSGDVPRTTLPAGYPRHNRERLEQHQPRTTGPYPSLLQLPSAVDLVRRGCYS